MKVPHEERKSRESYTLGSSPVALFLRKFSRALWIAEPFVSGLSECDNSRYPLVTPK